MRRLILPVLFAATAFAAASSVAQTDSIGVVTAYNLREIPYFREDRSPGGRIQVRALPRPPVKIEVIRGTTVGIRHGGELIFLRGIDVQYSLTGVVCRPRSAVERGASESVTGVGAGSGSAADCTSSSQ